MNWLILLDVLLIALGLLALSPRLFGCGRCMAAVLAFYLGCAMIATACVDVGLIEWDQAQRPKSDEQGTAFAKRLAAHRSSEGRKKSNEPVEAPDFCLPSLDENRLIRLSDYRGRKPVVLLFGSFG